MYNFTRLAEALQQWPRSRAWKQMLQDPALPPDVRRLLRHHIETAALIEKWHKSPDPSRSDLPRYHQKRSKKRGKRPCKGCGEMLPHESRGRCLWLMQQKRMGIKYWSRQTPEVKKARTEAARAARWRQHWENKLSAVHPRIIKTLGRDKVLWLLKQGKVPNAS